MDVGMGGEVEAREINSGRAKLAPGDVVASPNLEAASSMHPLLLIVIVMILFGDYSTVTLCLYALLLNVAAPFPLYIRR